MRGVVLYDFSNLSPVDFEELVRDLLQAELKIILETFGPGRDQGIDCRHSRDSHSIIVQAKHYLRSGKDKLLANLKRENSKVQLLKPSRYIIATSVSMTPDLKEKIRVNMPSAPLEVADILGQEDLNNLLERHPEVTHQHFKLWLNSTVVLERILHSGVYNRSDTEMKLIKAIVPKFVQNDSLKEAEGILKQAGSLIISGDPGVGKTTLARMLIWLHASQGWKIFVVDDMTEAFEVSNPGEKRLVFFDDFLGQVRLSADHVRGLDRRLPPFLERVKSNKDLRFILTTREYILNQAALLSQRLSSTTMKANKYVLDVGVYTRSVRSRILYNHLYFSGLKTDQLKELLANDYYLKIIDHNNFNPRLIELLTSEDYTELSSENMKVAIEHILDHPDELWERPYRDHISDDGKALMIALVLQRGSSAIETLRLGFDRVSLALGQRIPPAKLLAQFSSALKELEGSILFIVGRRVSFSNPGVRDFLHSVFLKDDLLLSVLPFVQSVCELEQCWQLFIEKKPKPSRDDPTKLLWVAAMKRLEQVGTKELLKQLDLTLNISDHFGDPRLIPIIRRQGDQLQREGLSINQVREIVSTLENITMHLLDFDDQERLQEVITTAAASIC